MSENGIIFDPRTPTSSVEGIALLEFDVLLEENHEWGNEVTTSPVENGAPVSDHIIPQSKKYRLTAMVSDSSLYGELAEGADTPTQRAFDILEQLCDSGQLMTVFTKHKIYTDMALTFVGIPRSSANGDSLMFPMEFMQLRLVSTQTTEVPPGISKKLDKKSGESVKKKTEPTKNSGAKQPVAPATEKQKSVLSGLFGGA